MIEKIYVENFKILERLSLSFNEDLNIIVGDNETGKTTILEAITLALTGQLYGRYILVELSPYLFNLNAVDTYLKGIKSGIGIAPPRILIELYLRETAETVSLKGSNNNAREDAPGVSFSLEFNEDYNDEYQEYIADPSKISTIPSEYYSVHWNSFAFNTVTKKKIPINTTFIDTTTIRLQNRADYHIHEIINDNLSPKEKTQLALTYRELKQSFSEDASLKRINQELKGGSVGIANKDITVSIDISQRTSWEANLTTYLGNVPFQYIGKGEQNILKTMLALNRTADETDIILVEEPENHLSYTNMNALISLVSDKCGGKQLFISTHSTFVLNKLGLEKVILLGSNLKTMSLSDLPADTYKYFKKLPGYDTLRLLIAKKAILVEGPSDELIVQRAYMQQHDGALPISAGIDIISVRGLSFKRFLEIAIAIEKEVIVVIDNDGDYVKKVEQRYSEFFKTSHIRILYDKDNGANSLEPQLVKNNSLDSLNNILGCKKSSKEEILDYMSKNKTECALAIFQSQEAFVFPSYIIEAIADE